MQRAHAKDFGGYTRSGLERLLGHAAQRASALEAPVVVSITLRARHFDPLAILQSIYEPGERHLYLEHPARGEALAGAEAVAETSASGPARETELRQWAEDLLSRTISAGDLESPFAGPHFLVTLPFFKDPARAEPAFPAAHAFLPRWQVAGREGLYTAVANLLLQPGEDPAPHAARLWAAHEKFQAFDYGQAEKPPPTPQLARAKEVGTPEAFEKAVAEALRQIEAGAFHKIVLARAIDQRATAPLDPLDPLERLRARFPACMTYSAANGRGQTFIGATPERLLRLAQRTLQTEAIAGSIARGTTAREDAALARALLQSDKDRREHTHVIDSLTRRLQELGLTPQWAAQPRLLQLANVQHLHTPVTAPTPDNLHLLDAARVLHPTPAVGGVPRGAALATIPTLEPFPRGLYAGLVGWFDHRGEGELLVALRCALLSGETARLYAGAGIVPGSTPAKEREETEVKLQALRGALFG